MGPISICHLAVGAVNNPFTYLIFFFFKTGSLLCLPSTKLKEEDFNAYVIFVACTREEKMKCYRLILHSSRMAILTWGGFKNYIFFISITSVVSKITYFYIYDKSGFNSSIFLYLLYVANVNMYVANAGPSEGLKIRGCHLKCGVYNLPLLVELGLTDLPNLEGLVPRVSPWIYIVWIWTTPMI